tara:strand:- start:504 stop:1001 length:498 start_codon:yes stop_codon:yes gene_type:complete
MKIQKPNKVTYSSILKSIVSGIIMIGLIITIISLGIFIIFPSKNIEGATGARGLSNLEFNARFSPFQHLSSIKKPVIPGQLSDISKINMKNKYKSLENKYKSSENKYKSSENKDKSSENKDKSHENKDKSSENKEDKSPQNFNEIILSIMAPIGTIIKFPDKTNK